MESCEMCGAKTILYRCEVEGALLLVCNNCSRFGKVLGVLEANDTKIQHKPKAFKEQEFEIIEDFAKVIKELREKNNLKQEELALKISEKASLIHGLENGHISPFFSIARKLERFFGVKLIQKVEPGGFSSRDLRNQNLTIGDLIKIRKSKNSQ